MVIPKSILRRKSPSAFATIPKIAPGLSPGDASIPKAESSRILCPICGEKTLFQSGKLPQSFECGKCHQQLQPASSIQHRCLNCGRISKYLITASDQKVPCEFCGTSSVIPISPGRPTNHAISTRFGLPSIVISIVIVLSLIMGGMFLCFRAVSVIY